MLDEHDSTRSRHSRATDRTTATREDGVEDEEVEEEIEEVVVDGEEDVEVIAGGVDGAEETVLSVPERIEDALK